MKQIKLVALPCLCADVFYGTDIIRPGGEALNFAAHASRFPHMDVTLLGVVGKDSYAQAIMEAITPLAIHREHIRVDETQPTANNMTYLTPEGDRYYKPDSWTGGILENLVLSDEEISVLAGADVVFIHFYASCLTQVLELKKRFGFKLVVDFDVCRDFRAMETVAPLVDFFMVSGTPQLLEKFRQLSETCHALVNVTLAEKGSVTYHRGQCYQVPAVPTSEIVDTTGCGDSYHAGFVCAYLQHQDITAAMETGSKLAAETLQHYGGF